MLRNRMNSILMPGLLAAALLFVPGAVRAADVSDGAGFFSAEAIEKANQTIREIEKKSGHEVRIETHATVPTDKADAVAKMDAKQREKFFSEWLHQRAEVTKTQGVFLLICKEPSHLRLWAANSIQRAGFGAAQAKTVRETLLAGFKAKEYDKALTDAVAQLSTTFGGLRSAKSKVGSSVPANHMTKSTPGSTVTPADHAPSHRSAVQTDRSSPWGSLVWIIVFVVGGVLLLSLIGRMFRGGQSYGQGGPGYGGGYGGGGGGFLSGLTGGIFGAMAGNWMYDQFSGRHASADETHRHDDSSHLHDSSSGGGFDSGSGSSDGGFSGGTDFGGGSFGDEGGGDFGGGDDF